jgi:hypothetical protein
MKTLSNYINSSNIERVLESCFDEEFNIIDEGKLGDSIAKLLGVSNMDHRTFADIWGKDTESKKDMATAQVVAAAEKDPELKKIAQKTFKRLENCESKEEAIKELIEWAEGIIRNGDGIKIPSLAIAVRNILKDQTDNKDALKTAKELDAWLNKKFPKDTKKTEKNIQKIEDTVAKTDEFKKLASDPDSEETGEEEKTDNSTLGITDDGEGKAVTPEQEEEAVSDTITDDKNFFIPLAKEAGIDGNNLRDAIIGLINDSLKNKTTDKDGNTVYKWKTDTKGFQTKNEGKLIKGLGAVLCGLMMINHKGMNEKIVDVLIDTGFSRNDYLNNLTKSE